MAAPPDSYKPGDIPYPEQDERKQFCKFHYKGVLIILIPIIFAPVLLGREVLAYRYIYLTLCIYSYYVCNVVPVGALAFLYIVFVPPFGIASSKAICMAHYTDGIYLVYGSFWTGIMMDSSKLSERFAMRFLSLSGYNVKVIQLLLMLITALLSFLTNHIFMGAIMMKVAQAIMVELDEGGVVKKDSEEETYEIGAKPYPSWPAVGIYLTVCYSATIGAMLSPLQDPNSVFMDAFRRFMPKAQPADGFSFLLLFAGPFLISLLVVWIWINILFLGLAGGPIKKMLAEGSGKGSDIKAGAEERKEKLGPWNAHAIGALVLMIIAIVFIVTRRPGIMPGWYQALKDTPCGASVPVMALTILFFALPANWLFCRYYVCREPSKVGNAPSVLGWKAVNANTPWGHHFFLCSAFGAVFAGVHSKFYVLLKDTLVRNGLGRHGCFFWGSFIGVLVSMLSPASSLGRYMLAPMFQAGYQLGNGPGAVAVPLAAALHIQYLLPCSASVNTIIAGWGNLRPYQFLLGGIVPTIFTFIFLYLFIYLLGETAFPDFANSTYDGENFTFPTVKPA